MSKSASFEAPSDTATVGRLLSDEMHKDKRVEFVAYRPIHPHEVGITFRIRTNATTSPKQILLEHIRICKQQALDFQSEIELAFNPDTTSIPSLTKREVLMET